MLSRLIKELVKGGESLPFTPDSIKDRTKEQEDNRIAPKEVLKVRSTVISKDNIFPQWDSHLFNNIKKVD